MQKNSKISEHERAYDIYNVALTSKRHNVALTLIRRCPNVACPLGSVVTIRKVSVTSTFAVFLYSSYILKRYNDVWEFKLFLCTSEISKT